MRRSWLTTAKCLLVALLGFVFFETNDLFFMVGGSEFTSFLITPSAIVQAICLIMFAVALLIPATRPLRSALVAIALCVALLGSHRLVVDNLHNEIRDVYMGATVQMLPLDPAHEGGLAIKRSAVGLWIGAGRDQTIWLFSPAGLGLDPAGLKKLTR